MLLRDLEVKKDAQAVAYAAAELILDLVSATSHQAAICLSGGTTPRLLYEQLAAPPFIEKFPWQTTHWFWGDERYVPEDNASSNYRMVQEAMLAHVPVPESNIHRVKTELPSPAAAASAYEATLQLYYGSAKLTNDHPLFLISLLGLGTDGHTASLFPNTEVLKEQTRWVSAVEGVKEEPRITLTYPVLNSSQHVIFLVTGAEKAAILKQFLDRDPALPSVHVTPVGQLHVLADQAALPVA
jgi:6-phosphogluconolactonase